MTSKSWAFPGMVEFTVSAVWEPGDGRMDVIVSSQDHGIYEAKADPVTVLTVEFGKDSAVMAVGGGVASEFTGAALLAKMCMCTPVVKRLSKSPGWTPSPKTVDMRAWSDLMKEIEEFYVAASVHGA